MDTRREKKYARWGIIKQTIYTWPAPHRVKFGVIRHMFSVRNSPKPWRQDGHGGNKPGNTDDINKDWIGRHFGESLENACSITAPVFRSKTESNQQRRRSPHASRSPQYKLGIDITKIHSWSKHSGANHREATRKGAKKSERETYVRGVKNMFGTAIKVWTAYGKNLLRGENTRGGGGV